MNTTRISRRDFLKRTCSWSGRALALSLVPGCSAARRAMASEDNQRRISRARKLSLREIAKRRVHHGPDRFINPFMDGERGGLMRFLRWKLFSRNRFKDQYREEVVRPLDLDWGPLQEQGDCSVMFLRHSSLLVRDLDRVLLVDPVFFGLFWFTDFSPIRSGLDLMPSPDHVLITHGHYDHLDVSSLRTLDPDTHVITPLGYDGIFEDLGMMNRTRLDWYQAYRDKDLEILSLPCDHWTMRNPITGPNRNLWGSYLIRGASGKTIFISGDAAYFDRYAEIGEEFAIDLAVFNLGAYEPRWFMAQSHINPEETVRAFCSLRARRLLVVHWGAFRLGDEPVHLPPVEIEREMEKAGLSERLVLLEPGGTVEV
ncbi:MAG: MBL fold metallo-hydrolase [Thermodesulfobacteriota bacterium]